MRRRVSCALTALAVVSLTCSAYVGAQAPAGRPAAAPNGGAGGGAIPRGPDGKPDMQGYWTNQTFTPLERPAEFKDKAFFTAEEAAAYAKRRLNAFLAQPEDAIHYDDAIWMSEKQPKGALLRTSIITDPPDGRIPPLSEEGRRRAAERAAQRKLVGPADSAQTRGLSERCIYWQHEGPPLLPTGYNSNLQIVQSPGYVVVIPEMMPVARIIPTDGRPKVGRAIRAYRGDSRGRWEGDTLVVETTNYSEKTAWRGASENLKVIERFTMLDANTIRYQFTVDDPSTWSAPWSGEYPMHRIAEPIFEYACHEGNYGIVNILSAARKAEAEAAASGSTP
ncbi:MAG TPA: hypothetical protein VNI78_10235 [Vicinamibacterales bacterium]|nr:hypothetical protein [Vicinamibacterales bacterium]